MTTSALIITTTPDPFWQSPWVWVAWAVLTIAIGLGAVLVVRRSFVTSGSWEIPLGIVSGATAMILLFAGPFIIQGEGIGNNQDQLRLTIVEEFDVAIIDSYRYEFDALTPEGELTYFTAYRIAPDTFQIVQTPERPE